MTPRLWAAVVVVVACLVAPAAAARQAPPASLTAAESNAEDIVDAALAHDRSGVISIATELKVGVKAQGQALRRDGVPAALVSQLEQRTDRVAVLGRTRPTSRSCSPRTPCRS